MHKRAVGILCLQSVTLQSWCLVDTASLNFCSLVQDVADKKKEITDDDLLALITDEVNQPVTLWSLLDLQVASLAEPVTLP